MALTLSMIGGAAGIGSFVKQVEAGLQTTITAILNEASTTPDYVVRRKWAQTCQKNLDGAAQAFAVPIASTIQALHPATYTDLSQITDSHVTEAFSSIWTQTAYANILPS